MNLMMITRSLADLEGNVVELKPSPSSSLSSKRSQRTGTLADGDAGRVTLAGDGDVPTVGSADFDREGTGDLERLVEKKSNSGDLQYPAERKSKSRSSSHLSSRFQETVSPGDSSLSVSGNIDEHTPGLLHLAREATGDLQHLVKKRSKSRSSPSLSSRSRESVTHGDSSEPHSGVPDVAAVGLPDFSVDSNGDLQHPAKKRSRSRYLSSSSQSHITVLARDSGMPLLGDPDADAAVLLDSLANPAEDHITLQFEQFEKSELQVPEAVLLRPEAVPLSSLPELEAKRNFQGGSSPLQHSPGPNRARSGSESDRRSGSVRSRRSDDGVEHSRRVYASSSRASSPALLHGAWFKDMYSHEWRHIATDAVWYDSDSDKEPENAGPSANDILDGWKAKLVSKYSEFWEYVHSATGIVIDVPPISLSEDVIKQFEVAASYGIVPKYCKGLFEDGSIKYKIDNVSGACPEEWQTSKHPKVIENEMKAYLADLKVDYTRRPEVTMLTSGQELPVDLQTANLSEASGILKVTNIDNLVITQLIAAYPEATLLPFFITCYFLLRTSHEDEATKELAQQIQGWYWMTHRGAFNDRYWGGKHYDVIYDDDRERLHFGYAQFLTMRRTKVDVDTVVRLSIFEFSTELSLVLIGTVKPDWDGIQAAVSTGGTFWQPTWWLPAVPTYLGFRTGAHSDADVRRYLTRLLRAVTLRLDDSALPRVGDIETKWNFEETPELLISFRLVMSTWKDGVLYLGREMDYFWEQAIKGPHVNDFARLKSSKQYAETLYQDLGAWIMLMEGQLAPQQDQSGKRAMDELKDTLGQISSFKQGLESTFQLLIGAIAIKDSEIQKKLAQESKLQARRSTALTALAAIYLPLSLTTGIFGMNVVEIQDGRPRYWAALAVAVGFMVATLPFLLWVYLDKDDQGQMPVRSTASRRHSVDSQQHQLENDHGTLSKTHSQDLDAKPLGIVRRRTTRYSQMDWAATAGSRPGSPRKKVHPEHMV